MIVSVMSLQPGTRPGKPRINHRLTTVEFHLFQTLYREPGRIFSRGQLIDRIYDDRRIVSDRTIDSHIKKLRKKLAGLLPATELIHSVYGAGYRYELNAKDSP